MSDIDVFEARFRRAYRLYLDEAPTSVDGAQIARTVAMQQPRFGITRPGFQNRALVWVAIAALTLLALVAALVVGSSLLTPRRQLSPTGITLLNGDTGTYSTLATDGAGSVWARGFGRILRLGPDGEVITTWTIADDAAFNASAMVPSRSRGVWLMYGSSIVHFDGQTFGTTVVAPEAPSAIAEAPDGELWAAFDGGRVLRWTGQEWIDVEPAYAAISPAGTATTSLAVDDDGNVWITWASPVSGPGSGVARFDGTTWTRYNELDPSLALPFISIIPMSPTDVWAGSRNVLFHFDGARWVDSSPRLIAAGAASVARGPDGDVWVGGSGDHAMPAVTRFDGTSWKAFGAEDGLTAHGNGASVTATARGVYAATSDGIFKYDRGQWQSLMASPQGPAEFRVRSAVSRDELWASEYPLDAGTDELWHYSGAQWAREDVVPDQPAPVQIAVAPDGSSWAVGTFGLARRGSGGWDVIDRTPATALAFEGNRTLWVVGDFSGDISTRALWQEVSDGESWTHRDLAMCPIGGDTWTSVLPDRAGGAWIGATMGFTPGGLAHFDGRVCVQVSDQDGSPIVSASAMSLTPDGDLMLVKDRVIDGRLEVSLARLSDKQLTIVGQIGDSMYNFFVAPDGTLWAASSSGPARYDGKATWTYPFSDDFVHTPLNRSLDYAVAQDGTLFGFTDSTQFGFADTAVLRFPHQ
jgi:hypothetical protein